MTILVHEFASGGGFAGRLPPVSLVREGAAMLSAVLADLAAIGGHTLVTTSDRRHQLAVPQSVSVHVLGEHPGRRAAQLNHLMDLADAVWFIAPESDGHLARLTAQAERRGVRVIGSDSRSIRAASDKATLPRRLARCGIPVPETRALPVTMSSRQCQEAARAIGYPVVIKPRHGAGCADVYLANGWRQLEHARRAIQRTRRECPLVVQRFVPGRAASVSLVSDGARAVPLAVNTQTIRRSAPFSYAGGATPCEHPLASHALQLAARACDAVPGIRGYIGIDMVLTDDMPIVIEMNPRVTTAYLGLRKAIDDNLAALILAASGGALPTPPLVRRRVRFTAHGDTRTLAG